MVLIFQQSRFYILSNTLTNFVNKYILTAEIPESDEDGKV